MIRCKPFLAGAVGICTLSIVVSLGGCGVIFPPPSADTDTVLRAILSADGVEAVGRPVLNEAKVVLGQALFYDKVLSGNQNISCSTCHSPTAATGDSLSLPAGQGGVGLGPSRSYPQDGEGALVFVPRNSPEVFNRAGFTTMFWDGRVEDNGDGTFTSPAGDDLLAGLESPLAVQAMFPVTSREEMRGVAGDNAIADLADDDLRGIWSTLMARVLAIEGYQQLFASAYPEVPEASLTFAHAANAMAAYEIEHWTLHDSPFDEYLRGDDTAMSDTEKRGALLFYGSAGCSTCHAGTLMTDEQYHCRCVPQLGPGKGDGADGAWDYGRERVTGDPAHRFQFRTPPLRNVAATGPWMHDGAYAELEAAVRHALDPLGRGEAYDGRSLPGELESEVHAEQFEAISTAAAIEIESAVILSDAEFDDLVSFLHALTSPSLARLPLTDIPERVPSGLPLAD